MRVANASFIFYNPQLQAEIPRLVARIDDRDRVFADELPANITLIHLQSNRAALRGLCPVGAARIDSEVGDVVQRRQRLMHPRYPAETEPGLGIPVDLQ